MITRLLNARSGESAVQQFSEFSGRVSEERTKLPREDRVVVEPEPIGNLRDLLRGIRDVKDGAPHQEGLSRQPWRPSERIGELCRVDRHRQCALL